MGQKNPSDRRERTETITTTVPDDGTVLDAEDDLEDALRALHDFRCDPNKEDLAEAAQKASSAAVIAEDLLQSE